MYELHKNEQYFFTSQTLDTLARFLEPYARVAVLCAPMPGRVLNETDRDVRMLDIDNRFARVRGYLYWDIQRPERLAEAYDIIVCDPPFFNVSLSRLFRAIRMLAHERFDHPLLLSYPTSKQRPPRNVEPLHIGADRLLSGLCQCPAC
jgi:putative N6-adenine methyltransferase